MAGWVFLAEKTAEFLWQQKWVTGLSLHFWWMTFMGLETCMKCRTPKDGFQMHHLLNLWKKVVPIRSRDVPNAICLFHTRPQESCVVILGVGLV